MPFILSFLFIILLPFASLAQQSDTPPAPPSATPSTADTIGQILFDAVERKAIETFYDKLPEGEAGKVIKDVVQAATQTDGSDAAKTEEDDDDDDKDDVKKDKSKKGKGNGKNKDKNKKMPPGLAKRNSLPPGLQKQLDRNGTLPPGLAKRGLPSELEAQLPPPVEGTERVIAGNDVVLVEQATGIILDILKDVITK